MCAAVVARLCLVYCPLAAAIGLGIAYLVLGRRAPVAVPWGIAGAAGLLFLLMQSALAYAWNRRAARLALKRKHKIAGYVRPDAVSIFAEKGGRETRR